MSVHDRRPEVVLACHRKAVSPMTFARWQLRL